MPNEAWPQVARIYEAGIATKNGIYESQASVSESTS